MNDMAANGAFGKSEAGQRDVRTRKARLARAAEDAGISSDVALELLQEMSRLFPQSPSLSSGQTLAEQLNAIIRLQDSHRGHFSFMDTSGGDFDPAVEADKIFRDSEILDRLEGTEGDLFQVFSAILRMRSKELQALGSLDAMLQHVLLQLKKRDRKLEVAHFRLPKTIIPFYQVMRASGIGRDLQRPVSSFFKRFVALCVEHGHGRVHADELLELARYKNSLFEDLSDDANEEAEDGLPAPTDEKNQALELEYLSSETHRLVSLALEAGAHLDVQGRLVISDLDAFMASDIFEKNPPTASAQSAAGQEPKVEEAKLILEQAADAPPPASADNPRVPEALEKLSSGFARAKSRNPFAIYEFVDAPAPFQHVPLREFPADRPAPTGEIDPLDLVRLEANDGMHKWQIVQGRSGVLGRLHPLMLPPHSSAIWYGQQLGWGEVEMRELARFGNAGEPTKIDIDADPMKMLRALRGVAELQLRDLARVEPSHLLAHPAKASIAAEDLSLWWLYVLFYRHHAGTFIRKNKRGLFHGVEAPDVSMQDGKAVMGDSYIRIISIDCAEAEQMGYIHLLEEEYGDDVRRRAVYQCEW